MNDEKHNENSENCPSCKEHMMMDCCMEHKMSKEHLAMKKKMLEEKLKWVEEELAKK